MNSNDLVSRNVQRFRMERQMSLGDLARRSGLSKQTLSKIEVGTGNPTIDTLEAVATALSVSLRRLVTEWGTRVYLVRAGQGQGQQSSVGEGFLLDTTYGSGYVRTSVLTLSASQGPTVHEPTTTGTLLHVYVISGRVLVGPEHEVFELSEADFIRFPADSPYRFHSLSETAVVHLVTTIPQVPQFGPTSPEPI